MPEISIPRNQESDFEFLFSITKQNFSSLLELLKSEKPGISPQKFSEKFYEKLELPKDKLSRIIRIVYGINQTKISSSLTNDEIIESFTSSLTKNWGNKFPPEISKEYFTKILEASENVSLTVMAADLITEREKILREVDILTDIRPVFKDSELKGITVIHSLKLEYSENEKDKLIIYLAMDDDDLNNLEKLIKLAKERILSLKSNVSGNYIDFE
jgi:hypothetical protein